MQYNATQYNAIQYNAIQYSTPRHSTNDRRNVPFGVHERRETLEGGRREMLVERGSPGWCNIIIVVAVAVGWIAQVRNQHLCCCIGRRSIVLCCFYFCFLVVVSVVVVSRRLLLFGLHVGLPLCICPVLFVGNSCSGSLGLEKRGDHFSVWMVSSRRCR
jgi:hypothetical protein